MYLSFPRIRMANISVVGLLFCAQVLSGQTPDRAPRQESPEVLRVYTDLVQTDVMVFDQQGRFVDGLKSEDFQLFIDGKPKTINFFEKVVAGSASEESQLAAARGSSVRPHSNTSLEGPSPLDRGRPVFFYVDDLHLDISGINLTRRLLTSFIEKGMGQNDQAAIASASGQIGFLQQLTDNKTVLRAALGRLKFRSYPVRDLETPQMSEHQALLIDNYDPNVTDYFIDETLRKNPGISRETAERLVRSRAQSLMRQSAQVTVHTLAGLEGLVRSANKLPGRKLIFFISGGFFLDHRHSDTTHRLRRITSAAARSGVVIYSMDARGLSTTVGDAGSEPQFDPTGRLLNSRNGGLVASQDGLNALARDTGGKPIFNTNVLEPGLNQAIKETSTYYLLAWKPERDVDANQFRRIEVKIANKPELRVQVRRGFFDVEPEPPVAKAKKPKEQSSTKTSAEVELKKALLAQYPQRDIPLSMRLSYLNTPKSGLMLSASFHVPNESLSFVAENAQEGAVVDVAGAFYNDRGLPGSTFSNRLTVNAQSRETLKNAGGLIYSHSVFLEPGLYQVRVAAQDVKSGRTGSANAWIEIPDLASGQLALSSLLIGMREQPVISNVSSGAQNAPYPVQPRIGRKFSSNGFLRFLTFVYNAARSPIDSKPDVALQVQLIRDDQPVVTTPLKKVSLEGIEDLTSIPYAAEMSLDGLAAGRYRLQIAVLDRVAKRSATQQARFEIE